MRRRQLLTACILSALLFTLLAVFRTNPLFVRANLIVSSDILKLRNDSLTRMLVILTDIFSIPFMSIFIAGVSAVLLWSDKRLAAKFAVTAALGAILFTVIKALIQAARPEGALIDVSGFSFPSGHATMATILFVFLAQLFENVSASRAFHLLFNLLALCMIIAVSVSRIYLGVHWLNDVLAGMLLGVFSSSFVGLFFERGMKRDKAIAASK